MDIAQALRERRTVHQFRAQPLPPGALDREKAGNRKFERREGLK